MIVLCPNCQKEFRVPQEKTATGGQIQCPSCKHINVIPAQAPLQAAPTRVQAAANTSISGSFIIIVVIPLIAIGIAFVLPWIGLLLALGFIGLATASLLKKVPRSAFAIVDKTPLENRSRIVILSVADVMLGVLLIVFSTAGIHKATVEKSAIEERQKAKIAEMARKKVEEENRRKRLVAALPSTISDANKILSTINDVIDKKDYIAAQTSLTNEVNKLKPYLSLPQVPDDLHQVASGLNGKLQHVSSINRAIQLAEKVDSSIRNGDDSVSKRSYVEADDTYAAALTTWNQIDPNYLSFVERGDVGSLIEKKRARIARKVAKARVAAEKAAKLAAEKAAIEERRKARQFRLGDFYYWIEDTQYKSCVGNSFVRECAGPGATFLIVPYVIENMGKSTSTVLKGDFEIHDDQDRRFRPSSEAETALVMSGRSKDFLLSELHPGVQRHLKVVFEIPKNSRGLNLVVPEKGLLSTGKKVIPL